MSTRRPKSAATQTTSLPALPPDRVTALTEALRGLGPLAEEVVVTALRLALERAASAFVAEQARSLEDAGLLEQVQAGLDQRTR